MKAWSSTTLTSLYRGLTARRGLHFPPISPWHPLGTGGHFLPPVHINETLRLVSLEHFALATRSIPKESKYFNIELQCVRTLCAHLPHPQGLPAWSQVPISCSVAVQPWKELFEEEPWETSTRNVFPLSGVLCPSYVAATATCLAMYAVDHHKLPWPPGLTLDLLCPYGLA